MRDRLQQKLLRTAAGEDNQPDEQAQQGARGHGGTTDLAISPLARPFSIILRKNLCSMWVKAARTISAASSSCGDNSKAVLIRKHPLRAPYTTTAVMAFME